MEWEFPVPVRDSESKVSWLTKNSNASPAICRRSAALAIASARSAIPNIRYGSPKTGNTTARSAVKCAITKSRIRPSGTPRWGPGAREPQALHESVGPSHTPPDAFHLAEAIALSRPTPKAICGIAMETQHGCPSGLENHSTAGNGGRLGSDSLPHRVVPFTRLALISSDADCTIPAWQGEVIGQ